MCPVCVLILLLSLAWPSAEHARMQDSPKVQCAQATHPIVLAVTPA
jgi:hypothetical protein